MWESVDALLLPTVPGTPTVADTIADPHRMNTRMGRYTMFANLLDLAAIAVPAGFAAAADGGLPAGISLYAPAGADARLASIAARLHDALGLMAGATPYPVRVNPNGEPVESGVLVAVVGAHRTGQPLHPMLERLGAQTVGLTLTAPTYRLYALPRTPADPIRRPGLVRVEDGGESIEVELHRVSIAAIGELLVSIPAPLGLGTVELVDGGQAVGFLCEGAAIGGAEDISRYKSWINYLGEVAHPA